MMKMRRIMFIVPIFSLPIMCTLEGGLVLYITIFSSTHMLLTLYLNSERNKKAIGVLNYLPGSRLEKMVQNKLITYN